MKQLRLITPLLIVFLGLACTLCNAQSKPNVLWITIEDTSPQFIGCYGNQHASTPNIDRLAAEGVRFTQAYSTNTVCSPSRTTIITGVRTFEAGTGHHRSKNPVPDFMHGFPYYLQQKGYHTSNNSKTDYNIVNTRKYTNNAWNESSDTAGWWNRNPGQPFFAVFNFNDSHQSRTMSMSYRFYKKNVWDQLPDSDRIADDAFPMPPIYRDSPEMRREFARVYNSIKLTDNRIGELLKRLEADKLMDSTIIFFYADHGEGMPRGKTNGIGLGYRVPFIVWFPPMYEHLSPWGAGLITDELVSFEDLAPTLINLVGGEVPEYMKGRILLGSERSKPAAFLELSSDRSGNGIDMVRTIVDGRYLYSRNYMPFMPEVRYIRYMEIGKIKKIMRHDFAADKLTGIQKQIFAPRPAEFLFDIQADPWELENLAYNSDYDAIMKTMRTRLDSCVIQSRDVMFLPEYELAAIADNHTNAYQYRLDLDKYPLKEIYAAASLSGKRGNEIAEQQVKLLRSDNKIVRYWAALGLKSQDAATLMTYKEAIIQAVQDTYLPARITAAAVAYDVFADPESEIVLKKAISSTNIHASLMAINYLLYTVNKTPFTQVVQGVLDGSNNPGYLKMAAEDFLSLVDQ
ncbi:sulfatase [Sphingobacterium sp. SGG-5]|uniref:sulfatase family protein n=1 Tax=Sphingobacterium sp. SGG-5 TaxID=2710881 RepID=UPI0013EA5570|nr:sulfatase [Sphingobacterium sp. SGG-5]NGM63093.1 sulfatase [Sphingobacterium sp. SGG-5]